MNKLAHCDDKQVAKLTVLKLCDSEGRCEGQTKIQVTTEFDPRRTQDEPQAEQLDYSILIHFFRTKLKCASVEGQGCVGREMKLFGEHSRRLS